MCDNNIHNDLIEIDEQICPFCDILYSRKNNCILHAVLSYHNTTEQAVE